MLLIQANDKIVWQKAAYMKFILVGVLLFLLYRMMFKSKPIEEPPMQEPKIQEPEVDGFVDYEELE